MRQCPTCQRMYPDNSQNICPFDGTLVAFAASQQQRYYAGNQPLPYYGAPSYPPPPPPGWTSHSASPQGYGYSPQGYALPKSRRGTKLSRAALITGIGVIAGLGWSAVLDEFGLTIAAAIFILLTLLAAQAAIILSIVTLANASKDPAINKVHGILGLCFGGLVLLIWLLYLISH